MLTYELEPNQYSLRVYDSARGDMDYVSSALIQVNGDIGWVRQVSNPTFLDCLIENLQEILKSLGVTRLEATMNPAMARAFRMKIKGRAKYEEVKHVISSGRDLIMYALEPFSGEAGAGKQFITRQKEQQMAKKTVKVKFELLGDDGKVQCSSETEWIGLDPLQVLVIEKHMLSGILSLNEEVTSTLTK